MSIVSLASIFALTLVQPIFWERLGGAFGYVASISILGLFAFLTVIAITHVAVTETLLGGRCRRQDYSRRGSFCINHDKPTKPGTPHAPVLPDEVCTSSGSLHPVNL